MYNSGDGVSSRIKSFIFFQEINVVVFGGVGASGRRDRLIYSFVTAINDDDDDKVSVGDNLHRD